MSVIREKETAHLSSVCTLLIPSATVLLKSGTYLQCCIHKFSVSLICIFLSSMVPAFALAQETSSNFQSNHEKTVRIVMADVENHLISASNKRRQCFLLEIPSVLPVSTHLNHASSSPQKSVVDEIFEERPNSSIALFQYRYPFESDVPQVTFEELEAGVNHLLRQLKNAGKFDHSTVFQDWLASLPPPVVEQMAKDGVRVSSLPDNVQGALYQFVLFKQFEGAGDSLRTTADYIKVLMDPASKFRHFSLFGTEEQVFGYEVPAIGSTGRREYALNRGFLPSIGGVNTLAKTTGPVRVKDENGKWINLNLAVGILTDPLKSSYVGLREAIEKVLLPDATLRPMPEANTQTEESFHFKGERTISEIAEMINRGEGYQSKRLEVDEPLRLKRIVLLGEQFATTEQLVIGLCDLFDWRIAVSEDNRTVTLKANRYNDIKSQSDSLYKMAQLSLPISCVRAWESLLIRGEKTIKATSKDPVIVNLQKTLEGTVHPYIVTLICNDEKMRCAELITTELKETLKREKSGEVPIRAVPPYVKDHLAWMAVLDYLPNLRLTNKGFNLDYATFQSNNIITLRMPNETQATGFAVGQRQTANRFLAEFSIRYLKNGITMVTGPSEIMGGK
jgi:hypothetical protein